MKAYHDSWDEDYEAWPSPNICKFDAFEVYISRNCWHVTSEILWKLKKGEVYLKGDGADKIQEFAPLLADGNWDRDEVGRYMLKLRAPTITDWSKRPYMKDCSTACLSEVISRNIDNRMDSLNHGMQDNQEVKDKMREFLSEAREEGYRNAQHQSAVATKLIKKHRQD